MKKSILILMLFAGSGIAHATHMLAGRLSSRFISGYTYEIVAELWQEVGPAILADNCNFYVHFTTGDSILVRRSNGQSVNCSVPDYDGMFVALNVKYSRYNGVYTFPGPGLFFFHFSLPNRSMGVVNIPSSHTHALSCTSSINISNQFLPNSTFGYFADPLIIDTAQAWSYFQNDISVNEPDGDSVAYELQSCLGWGSNPISGYYIPGAFVDTTGMFHWPSPQPGPNPPFTSCPQEWSFRVVVKEYRMVNNSWVCLGHSDADFMVVVQCTLGEQETESSDWQVFPNPISPGQWISLSAAGDLSLSRACIYSLTGKLVFSTQLNHKDPGFRIPEDLSAGMFMLRLEAEDGQQKVSQLIVNQ